MNASSESGECASEMVRCCVAAVVICLSFPLPVGAGGKTLRNCCVLNSIVDGISLDGFKSRFFDQINQFGLRHLNFVVRFDRITCRQLAAFSYCAVNVVRTKVQRDLRE